MELKQALDYTAEKVSRGFKSDGCTFAPDMGIRRFCVMHDALLKFKPVTRFEADNLLFKGIWTKGKRYYPVACIYWLAVRWVAAIGGQAIPAFSLALLLSGFTALYFWG